MFLGVLVFTNDNCYTVSDIEIRNKMQMCLDLHMSCHFVISIFSRDIFVIKMYRDNSLNSFRPLDPNYT